MIQRQDESQDFQTPESFLELVREVFGGPIGLDPCTVASNPTRAANFYTPDQDGLVQPWIGLGPIFMNPPYGRGIGNWTRKAASAGVPGGHGAEAIALLPGRTDTQWFHRDVASASAVCFWAQRIRFVDSATGIQLPGAGKFPSVVAYWGPRADHFRNVFKSKGWTP